MNKILKTIFILLLILFLALYLGKYMSSYYENSTYLTDEAIERFEKDLKSGKDIDPNNYLPKEKNYNNKATRIGIKTSKVIENSFKGILRGLIRYLEDY